MLDWLFPPRCLGCGALGGPWCSACDQRTHWLRAPLCAHCGLPSAEQAASCEACRVNHYRFTAARSLAPYAAELRQALLAFKRQQNMALAQIFAAKLQLLYQQQAWQADLVLPVPLDAQREAQRGFNQAGLLAGPLAQGLGLPLPAGALRRKPGAKVQHRLTAAQRWQNLQGTFVTDKQAILGTHVLLVDDIMTTGATAQAISLALLEAGAAQVYVLTVGRSLFQDHQANLVR